MPVAKTIQHQDVIRFVESRWHSGGGDDVGLNGVDHVADVLVCCSCSF